MQKTPAQNASHFSVGNIWSTLNGNNNHNNNNNSATGKRRPSTSLGRPSTSSGPPSSFSTTNEPPTKDRERRPSFGRRPSTSSSPSKGLVGRRRSNSTSNTNGNQVVVTDAAIPPALPDFLLTEVAARDKDKTSRDNNNSNKLELLPSPASVDSFSRMLGRTAPTPTNGYESRATPTPTPPILPQVPLGEGSGEHLHIQEIANKRISTLDYLRKAHGGRVYWFNTLLFDKGDLARMPSFDSRKLARRAVNFLLLGLSLPTVVDLNSSSAIELLRSLYTLLLEFDSYQQIHTENGINTSSLSRAGARIPQMFRRGAAAGKARRTSGAGDLGYTDGGANGQTLTSNSVVNQTPTSVMSFGLGGEGNELIPGEEYTHLLTPSLPFDPDFFETFATLCDVLIDAYTKMLRLLENPRDCTLPVVDLFHKVDTRVRKIIIQGVVKEFEDASRTGLKQEVSNVGKVVLGGLM